MHACANRKRIKCAIYCLFPQGFFPLTNDIYTTETTIPAAYAAIHDINSNCSILPDYLLQLDVLNTLVRR